MKTRMCTATIAILLAAGLAFVALTDEARGDAKSELKKAEKSGKALWGKTWAKGAKTCAACHSRGPNKMSRARMDTYPKYDKILKKVVTVQQKLNQMITKNSKGEAFELGSDELNGLEAYIKSR